MRIEGTDTTHYTYDAFGNLLNVSLPNGDVIDYIVDGLNRRIEKRINGKTYRKWLYQDQLNPVAELDSNNNLPRRQAGVLSRFVYGSKINVPDYIIKGDSTYKVVADHLGSVRLVVNSESGYVVQEIKYDEFGGVLSNSNKGFQPFGFAGGLYDEQTKLTRFGARDYDSETGRWTAKDATLFGGGTSNIYQYCINDPVNYCDIKGKHFLKTHYIMSFHWGINNGFSIYDSHRLGLASIMADLIEGQTSINAKIANRHAMAGWIKNLKRYQTQKEALIATAEFINKELQIAERCKKTGNMDSFYEHMGYALHAKQDLSAILHGGLEWHNTPIEYILHSLTEALPSLTIFGYDLLVTLFNN